MHVIHPTTNETVDKILQAIEPGIWYDFYEVWHPAFQMVLVERAINEQQSTRCLAFMEDNKLVEKRMDLRGAHGVQEVAMVMLKSDGDTIRESGGWLKHLERTSLVIRLQNELTAVQLENAKAEKKRFRISVVLSVVTIVVSIFALYQTHRIGTLQEEVTSLSKVKRVTFEDTNRP